MLPEQKKKPRKHRVFKALMAEAVGFEPTCPCGQLHFESCAEKALAEKGRSELVSLSPDFRRCQAVFEGPKPEKRLWYESNRHPLFWPRLARFFGKMQDFMQDNWGPIFRMNTGFASHCRKTKFAKCKILGRFCVVFFQVSTICIVLVENMVVLRVQIQNKGEPQK